MNLECCKTRSVSRPGRRFDVGLLGAAMFTIALAGCAEAKPERVPVFPTTGKITFQGQPIPGAFVTLHPKTPQGENVPNPRASVTQDGSFKVTTYDSGDGAPAGNYVLTVLWYKPIKNGADSVAGPNVIPPKYSKPETSDKEVILVAGDNNLPPIQL
jgi:hypothetical protein